MTLKARNVENCVASLSFRSACLSSLLVAGVTSASTLALLGIDCLLEGNSAQASPVSLVNPDLTQAIATEPTGLELSNSEQSSSGQIDAATPQPSNQPSQQQLVRPNAGTETTGAIAQTAPTETTAPQHSQPANSTTHPKNQAFTPSLDELEQMSLIPAATPLPEPIADQQTHWVAADAYNFAQAKAGDFHSTTLSGTELAKQSAPAPAAASEQSAPPTQPPREFVTAQAATQSTTPATTLPETANQKESSPEVSRGSSALLGRPSLHLQGAYILQGDESSARARATGTYVATPYLMFGATVDFTTGHAFSDSEANQISLNELYFTVSPPTVPNLRLTAGLIDLTSYFDRNSFAKDAVTHFFNPVFQTNPALAATGIGSRIGALVNWSVFDNLDVKAAAFSSDRNLGNFALDGFAGEVAMRFGNFIVRGTYATDRDEGQRDGFREIFQFRRDQGRTYGIERGDREEAYGINTEYFIPELKLGLFGRYGHYENVDLGRGGDTFSFGFNLLDLFMRDDRLGLGYGRDLSNDGLRRDRGDKTPDVLEAFYDFRITPNLRAGVTLQERNQFSETLAGFRIRVDFDVK